jgi:hypothetical protein
VLKATIDLWRGSGSAPTGEINQAAWERGYATMRRLGLITGSVPLSEMFSGVLAGSG